MATRNAKFLQTRNYEEFMNLKTDYGVLFETISP